MSTKLDNDIEAVEHRSCLSRFTLKIDEINTEIDGLQNQKHGANWIYKNLSKLSSKNQLIPEKIVRQMNLVVKQRNATITKQREASDSEVRALEAQLDKKINKPYYIDEEFHRLHNIDVLYPENDLREILIINIKSQIPAFVELDIDNLTLKDLRRWSKWANSIELQIDHAKQVIASAQNFLTQKNLLPLQDILTTSADLNLFKSYINSLPT